MKRILYILEDRLKSRIVLFKRDLKYIPKIFSGKPLLSYLGWVGYGNMGDEMLLAAHQGLFSNYEIIPYHPHSLIAVFTRLNKRYFKGCILGGGTLIDTPGIWRDGIQQMLKLKLPTFALGTGVNFSLQRKDIVKSDSLKKWIEPLNQFDYVGVRGPISGEILNSYLKKSVDIFGDTVLSLAPELYSLPIKNNTIGICVGHSKEIPLNIDVQKYAEICIAFITNCIAKGFDVVLLPVWKNDLSFNKMLLKKVNNRKCVLLEVFDDHKQYLSAVAKCTLFVGQKLHGTIAATIMRVPSIMISYHPKCFDYMKSIGMERWEIPLETFNITILEDRLSELSLAQDQVRSSLDVMMLQYRSSQYKKVKDLQERFLLAKRN